jgi:hypothetical protein
MALATWWRGDNPPRLSMEHWVTTDVTTLESLYRKRLKELGDDC